MSDIFESTSEVTVNPPSAEELAILQQQARALGITTDALAAQAPFQQRLLESTSPLIDVQAQGNQAVQNALTPKVQQNLVNQQLGLQQGALGFQAGQLGRAETLDTAATGGALSQLDLQQLQLADLTGSQGLQDQIRSFQQSQLGRAEGNIGAQNALVGAQLNQVQQGIAPTEQQTSLINQVADEAIKSGEIDIQRFQDQALEQLREEFAPAAGLRPGDTPVTDRAGRVQAEALRQFGQLSSGARLGAAQSQLNFPLAAAQTLGGQNLAQQQILGGAGDFQSLLAQNAVNNRQAALSGLTQPLAFGGGNFGGPNTQGNVSQALTGGLGLAGQAPNVSGFQRGSSSSSQDLLGGIGGILIGAGGLLNN